MARKLLAALLIVSLACATLAARQEEAQATALGLPGAAARKLLAGPEPKKPNTPSKPGQGNDPFARMASAKDSGKKAAAPKKDDKKDGDGDRK